MYVIKFLNITIF